MNITVTDTEALTFDDVQIIPSYSEIRSREDVNLRTKLSRNYELEIPLIAAPMDTVVNVDVAHRLWRMGGIGIIHRFMSVEEQVNQIVHLSDKIQEDMETGKYGPYPYSNIGAAIGANGDAIDRAINLIEAGANIIVIDVAHGHHLHVKNTIQELLKLKIEYPFDIIAGSIATSDAALDLQDWGADALRVGVGGGSVCETRIRTGIGVPQLQSIIDIVRVANIPVISDGGIRYPGDVAKALAAGADTVMIGSLFAGTDEAPGEVFVSGQWPNNKKLKIYRGLASATTKLKYAGAASHVEGASKMIETRGPIDVMIDDLTDGVKSSMSYVGASTLQEFRAQSRFLRITLSGLAEAHPHLLK